MLALAPPRHLAALGPGKGPPPHHLRLSPPNSALSGPASEAEDRGPLHVCALSVQPPLLRVRSPSSYFGVSGCCFLRELTEEMKGILALGPSSQRSGSGRGGTDIVLEAGQKAGRLSLDSQLLRPPRKEMLGFPWPPAGP